MMKSQLEKYFQLIWQPERINYSSCRALFHISPSHSRSFSVSLSIFALFVSPFCCANEHVTAIQCTTARRRHGRDAEIQRYIDTDTDTIMQTLLLHVAVAVVDAPSQQMLLSLWRLYSQTTDRERLGGTSSRAIHPSAQHVQSNRRRCTRVCVCLCVLRPSFLFAVSACHFDTFICFGQAGQQRQPGPESGPNPAAAAASGRDSVAL